MMKDFDIPYDIGWLSELIVSCSYHLKERADEYVKLQKSGSLIKKTD